MKTDFYVDFLYVFFSDPQAPARVNNNLCKFVVDASKSRVKQLLIWQGEYGDRGRRLQNVTTTLPPWGHLHLPKPQSLGYRWEVRQLAAGIDDAPEFSVPIISDVLNEFTFNKLPFLEVRM